MHSWTETARSHSRRKGSCERSWGARSRRSSSAYMMQRDLDELALAILIGKPFYVLTRFVPLIDLRLLPAVAVEAFPDETECLHPGNLGYFRIPLGHVVAALAADRDEADPEAALRLEHARLINVRGGFTYHPRRETSYRGQHSVHILLVL